MSRKPAAAPESHDLRIRVIAARFADQIIFEGFRP